MPQEGAMPQQWVAYTSQQHPTQHHLPPGQVHGALGPRGTNHGRGGRVEKIPLRYSKSTSGLLEQSRVPHGYSSSKNVVFATHGVETVVLATHGFADLPLDYLTPSSPTSPLPDPFIYHSPTNVFFRYIICSKFVQIKFSKVVTRSRRVRA